MDIVNGVWTLFVLPVVLTVLKMVASNIAVLAAVIGITAILIWGPAKLNISKTAGHERPEQCEKSEPEPEISNGDESGISELEHEYRRYKGPEILKYKKERNSPDL